MYTLDLFATAVAPLGGLLLVLPFAAALAAWCWISGDRRGLWAIAVVVIGTLVTVAALKFLSNMFGQPWRPHWDTISNLFPSGHVAMATVVYGAAVLCIRRSAPRWTWVAGAVVVFTILGIAVERITSGSHPLLDVIGGGVLGGLGLYALVRLWPSGKLCIGGLPALALVAVLVALLFYGKELPTSGWVERAVKDVRATVQ